MVISGNQPLDLASIWIKSVRSELKKSDILKELRFLNQLVYDNLRESTIKTYQS